MQVKWRQGQLSCKLRVDRVNCHVIQGETGSIVMVNGHASKGRHVQWSCKLGSSWSIKCKLGSHRIPDTHIFISSSSNSLAH